MRGAARNPLRAACQKARACLLALTLLLLSGAVQAAISLRVSDTLTGNTGQIDLSRVDGTGEGDLMLAVIMVEGRSAAQVTDPVGWTRADFQNASGSQHTLVICYRFAAAGDVSGASPTWTWDYAGNREFVASMLVFRGVDTSNPVNDISTASYTNNSAATTVPAVTPTVDGTLLVAASTINRGATFTWAAPMTEQTDAQTGAGGGNVSMTTATGTGPAANASSGTRSSTASGADNRRVAAMVALAPATVPGPVLRWRFDEASWNGTANEVRDASGNGLRGTAAGTGTSATTSNANAGSPAFCRSGLFASANSQYVEVATSALLDITDRLTITAWVRPTALAGALTTVVSKDENYEFHVSDAGAVNWWWTTGANAITTANGDVPLGAWTHIAIVYTRGAQEVYVNGVLAGNNWTDPDRNALTTNADPFQVGNDQGAAGRFWDGQIDEVRVYNYAMSAADVLAVRNDVPSPLCPLDRIAVTPSSTSASTCLPQSFTFAAIDGNGSLFPSYTGTIAISVSTGRGDWAYGGGPGSFSNGAADDGAAQYGFDGTDGGDVVLNLTNRSQDTLTVTATDSVDASVTGTSASVNFADNAFVFSEDLASRIAGNDVAVAGRAHDMRATYIYRDSVTSNCGTLTSYTGAKSIKAWITRAGTDPAGAAPQIGATGLPDAAPGANNLSITFVAGVASFDLSTTDVGKYAISFQDDAPVVANTSVTGSSGSLTVRPFTIAVSGIRQGATENPRSNTPAGALFAAAGTAFEMSLGAYRHSATADADDDGVPDASSTLAQVGASGVSPSFAATATFAAVAPFTPAAGGVLSNGSVAMSAGTANPTSLGFSEVGSFTLSTNNVVTSYLGTVGVDLDATVFDAAGAQTTASPVIGRFRPDHFFVSASTLATRDGAGCSPASTFTYMGEGIGTTFTLQARSATNAVTQNYTTSSGYAKLDPATIAQLGFGAVSGGTNLTARLDTSLGSSGSFTAGSAAVSAVVGIRRPSSPDDPDGPYAALKIGIAPSDSDGTALRGADLDMDVDGGGNDRRQIGADTEVRFGRVRMQNALGSEKLPLPVPIEVQYWDGDGFATNAADSCTVFDRENFALGSYTGSLAACETALAASSVSVTGGTGSMSLMPPCTGSPCAGNTGSVLLTLNLAPTATGSRCDAVGAPGPAATSAHKSYLLGRWLDSDSAEAPDDGSTRQDDNPSARAAFGLYPGQSRRLIYFRENY